jgi:RNA polymerase sigma-70 factor (TIGR02957 family)
MSGDGRDTLNAAMPGDGRETGSAAASGDGRGRAGGSGGPGDATSVFAEHRDVLFTVAYEMLGSAADAEDVLQETWLRWANVDHNTVHNARAYLARAVARMSLNRLRTLKRQREEYIGPWLPEPVATDRTIADDVELADSVSLAMLIVLESLSPTERAVFVMRDVFGFDYGDIADAIDKSQAAVRQIAHRAREHVRERRDHAHVTSQEHTEVSERFFRAAVAGDIQQLMDALAPGVVLITDGGGVVKAALNPIYGRDKVLRFLQGVRPEEHRLSFQAGTLNGAPALLSYVDGVLDTVVATRVQDGLITELYVMRNPHKLRRVDAAVSLRR